MARAPEREGSGNRQKNGGGASRHEQRTGIEGTDAVAVGSVKRNERHEAGRCASIEGVDGVHGAEASAVNEARRDEWMRRAIDPAEEHQQTDDGNGRWHEERSRPCVRVPFPQVAGGKHAGEEAAAEQHHAGGIHSLATLCRSRRIARDVAHRQQDNRHTDRHVDEKYAAPGPVRDEQSSEDRADHRTDRKEAAEQADRAIAHVTKVLDDDAGCGGCEPRAAGRL